MNTLDQRLSLVLLHSCHDLRYHDSTDFGGDLLVHGLRTGALSWVALPQHLSL
jgi:hypothetical protein